MGLMIALVSIVVVFLILLAPKFFPFLHFAVLRAPFFVEADASSKQWLEDKIKSAKKGNLICFAQSKSEIYLFTRGLWFIPFQASSVHKVMLLRPGEKIEVDRDTFIALVVTRKTSDVFVSTTCDAESCAMFPFGSAKSRLALAGYTSTICTNFVYGINHENCAVLRINFTNNKRCKIWWNYDPS